jgi:hypothetical protein
VEDYPEKYILPIIFHHAKRFLTKRKSYDEGLRRHEGNTLEKNNE